MGQISLFDGSRPFKINKPIRLIELFAGYGSQHFALEYLGASFESWKICEWAVKSIQAYKDAHFKDDNLDYSKYLTKEEVFKFLADKGISSNYNDPMTYENIKRMGEEKARTVYNNICATCNLVNIQQAKGKDFDIVDTDKYCYIMTYSFPCQDLSSAGFKQGMEKGSGTRSGMLWEVERILDELKSENREMPQVLLMENVPEVIGSKNIKHFSKWLERLEEFGYKSKWEVLNSSNFGVPQNRERCFMISVLGDYYYDFPKTQKLEKHLEDLLELEVDEKYFLTPKQIKYVFDMDNIALKGGRDVNRSKLNPKIAKTISCRGAADQRADVTNFILNDGKQEITVGEVKQNLKQQLCNNLIKSGILKQNYVINHSYTNGLNGKNPNSRQTLEDYIETTNNISPTLTTRPDTLGVVVPDIIVENNKEFEQYKFCETKDIKLDLTNLRIRKLTPKECFRLMGVKDKDFENIAENQSNASLYHLAGDSIVVEVLMAMLKEMLC